MNFPPKAISILLLVQCLFIWMGCGLARKMFRAVEQFGTQALASPMPACASLVLGVGFWALLLPLSFAFWVSLRSEAPQGIPIARTMDTHITLGLTVVIVCLWSYGAMQALDVALSPRSVTVMNLTN